MWTNEKIDQEFLNARLFLESLGFKTKQEMPFGEWRVLLVEYINRVENAENPWRTAIKEESYRQFCLESYLRLVGIDYQDLIYENINNKMYVRSSWESPKDGYHILAWLSDYAGQIF